MFFICFFLVRSRRSRPRCWAATSRRTINTSWQDLETRRPPSTRSSTRAEGGRCPASALGDFDPPRPPPEDDQRLQMWKNLTDGNRWRFEPEEACAERKKKVDFVFILFLFQRVLFFGFDFFLFFFVTSEFFFVFPGKFGCYPVEAALHFPRRLVKSVHIELNKRHFIYIIKIYIFSCPGCTCDDFFFFFLGPLCLMPWYLSGSAEPRLELFNPFTRCFFS